MVDIVVVKVTTNVNTTAYSKVRQSVWHEIFKSQMRYLGLILDLKNLIQTVLQDTYQTKQVPNIQVCVYLQIYKCDLVRTALVADPPLITIEALMTLFYPLIESNHRVSYVLWAEVRLEGPGKEDCVGGTQAKLSPKLPPY